MDTDGMGIAIAGIARIVFGVNRVKSMISVGDGFCVLISLMVCFLTVGHSCASCEDCEDCQ